MKVDFDWTKMEATAEINDSLRLIGTLERDDEASPPWEEDEGDGSVVTIDRGIVFDGDKRKALGDYLSDHFGEDHQSVLARLVCGEVVNDAEGRPCLGIEAYIHSGEAWYLPGGCRVDRQWDVTALRAIWRADEHVLANIHGDRNAEDLRDYLRGRLPAFNQFLSGDVWYVTVRIERRNEHGEWDLDGKGGSCGWLYGDEGVTDFMCEEAFRWADS